MVATAASTGASDALSAPDPDATMMRRGLRLLWRYMRMHPGPLSVSLTGAVLFSAMAVLSASVLGSVTDEVLIPAFEDDVSNSTVWKGAAAVLVVAFLRGVGVVVRRYWGAMTSRRIQATLRSRLARHYSEVPLGFFRTRPTGQLLANADTDVEVGTEVMLPLPFSIGLFVLLTFAVISLFLVDWVVACIGLVLFPALGMLNRYYTRRVERPAERVQERIGTVSAIAHESFDGALVVKALGREADEVARLTEASDRLREARVEVGRLRATFEPTLEALPNLGIIAVLMVGGWRVDAGAVTTGDLVQVMALFSLLVFPMRVFGYLLEELPRSVVASARVDEVLGDDGGARGASGDEAVPAGPLSVDVADVEFAYVPGEPVIVDCSLHIDAGETVALVGSTGSGKSTLCELLVGLIPVDAGTIRLGGVPMADLAAASVRESSALVFQESFLFADTVGENITVGSDAGEHERDWAAEVAHAAGFISRLPRGYATVVGERGVTLSGGQRQRVALARALVRRPRLLVLDDATSAVDPTVESRILADLGSELSMTTVIVAHRLSTIELADRVLFLSDGRIVATGTHSELLSLPEYQALVLAYEQDAA